MKLLVFRLDKQEAVTPLPSPAGTRRRGLSLAGRWGAAGAQRWPRQPHGSPQPMELLWTQAVVALCLNCFF